jgi:hypothetical protein
LQIDWSLATISELPRYRYGDWLQEGIIKELNKSTIRLRHQLSYQLNRKSSAQRIHEATY